MATKPTKEGDPIESGPLLRFIPNWDQVTWEYDRDRPSPRAWRTRKNETYVSLYREAEDEAGTSLEALHALKPEYAIYRVTAEALIALQNVEIKYHPDRKLPEGHAHVGVYGINRSRAEKLARDPGLTERAKPVGPAGRPPVSDPGADDAPDHWRGRS